MYNAAFKQLSDAERKMLQTILADWKAASGIPPLAASNLEGDDGGVAADYRAFLSQLVARQNDLRTGDPKGAFEEVSASFWLSGLPASAFGSALFGRAILLHKYAGFLERTFDRYPDLRCTDDAPTILTTLRRLSGVSEAAAGAVFRPYFEGMRRTLVGKGATFATFASSAAPSDPPWSVPLPSAADVRTKIALGEDEVGKDYILLSYQLPSGVAPSVPIVASPGWNYQRWFRPNAAAQRDGHGWTSPLDGSAGVPEVVHPEFVGSTLVFPFHVAKA